MTRKIYYNLISAPDIGTSKITSKSSITVFGGAADESNYLIYDHPAKARESASSPPGATRTSAGLLDELRLSEDFT